MKVIRISKQKLIIACMMIAVIFVFSITTSSFGMQHYYKLDFSTGLVTATKLNVRSGPSTKYSIVTTVNKNEYIRVFAGVGNWYIIQTDNDYVGAVSKEYVKPIYPSSNNTGSTNQGTTGSSSTYTMNADEQEVFNLINEQRTKQGLPALKQDAETRKGSKN